jgi:hypothetical protein
VVVVDTDTAVVLTLPDDATLVVVAAALMAR